MSLLHYAEFRTLRARRQAANDGIMALLAGSKLAVNTLRLTTGSTHRLSEIFTDVQHIERFDLRTDRASAILDEAEAHLALMAIPYVMALHEDYMGHACRMLIESGRLSPATVKGTSPKSIHDRFEVGAGVALSQDELCLFQYLRTFRNCLIHEGGLANAEMVQTRHSVTQGAEVRWVRVAHELMPTYRKRDPIDVRQCHIIAALAVTSALMKEVNLALQGALSREFWAERAVRDAMGEGRGARGNPNQRLRSIRQFVRSYYGVLGLTDDELVVAGSTVGLALR